MTKGFDIFLPRISIRSRHGGIRYVIQVPMFSGYHEAVDRTPTSKCTGREALFAFSEERRAASQGPSVAW